MESRRVESSICIYIQRQIYNNIYTYIYVYVCIEIYLFYGEQTVNNIYRLPISWAGWLLHGLMDTLIMQMIANSSFQASLMAMGQLF